VDRFDFSSNAEPTYRVRIEGRLLDDDFTSEHVQETVASVSSEGEPGANKEPGANAKTSAPKFSQFFKAISVDFPPHARRPEQGVEWKRPDRGQQPANSSAVAEFDDFCFKRNGDENINITINLIRHQDPERFLLSPELAAIVDMNEASRHEAMMAVWEYIRLHGLQEEEEKRNFRCDDLLKKVCNLHLKSLTLRRLLTQTRLSVVVMSATFRSWGSILHLIYAHCHQSR
jgi:SWI/SNF-related matrix-associated actin-dependent regulator of chromatin subfamily D